MTQSNQVWAVILFYVAAQGLFMSGALLLVNRGRRLANRLLAAMVLAATAGVVSWFLVAAGWIKYAPVFGYAPGLLDLTLGPLFYFYAKTLLHPEYKPRAWTLAAAIGLPGLLRLFVFYARGVSTERVATVLGNLRESDIVFSQATGLIWPALFTAYGLVFMYLAWRHIRRVELMCNDEFSNSACAHIRWLKVLNMGLFAFAAAVVLFLINLAVTLHWYAWLEYAESLVRGFIIQAVALSVFFLPEAFSTDLGELNGRRRRLTIDDTAAESYLKRLQEYMALHKPYRAEDLRLADLAASIGVSAHVLSQLINDQLQTNFSDFVNQYRVNDTQEMLRREANDKYTFVALAREAGFNSKTSFYRAFKKHTGMSPSEYRSLARQPDRAAAN